MDQLVKDGRLRRCGNGIVAAAGAPVTRQFHLMRGVLLGGHGTKAGTLAAIADITAAVSHSMADGPLDPIHIVTTRRVEPQPGYIFHRTSRMPTAEIVLVDGIPTTDPLRTFIDICHSAPPRGTWVFLRGLRAGHYTKESASIRVDAESRQGRGGLVIARSILDNLTEGAEKARSGMEETVYGWIVEAGLPLPERNALVLSLKGFKWEIDLLYREDKTAIEISPYDIHGEPETYWKDHEKREDLENQGYRVLTVTERTSRARFLETLRRHLGV
jgi:hypothetical protein